MEFLTSLRAERPDLADDLDELSVFYQSELWHQISLKLESIVQSEGFGIGDTLLLLYKHFVASFGSKLNQLKLAQFAVKISERISDINERIGFLEELQKTLKENAVASTNVATAMGPQLFVEMTVLQSKLMKEEIELCKKKINEAKETLEELNNVDPLFQLLFCEKGVLGGLHCQRQSLRSVLSFAQTIEKLWRFLQRRFNVLVIF